MRGCASGVHIMPLRVRAREDGAQVESEAVHVHLQHLQPATSVGRALAHMYGEAIAVSTDALWIMPMGA